PRRSRVPSSCTRCMPIRSRAMASVLRSKKARGGLRGGLARGFTARDSKGIHYNGPAGRTGVSLVPQYQLVTVFSGKAHERTRHASAGAVPVLAGARRGSGAGERGPAADRRFDGGG